MCEFFDRLPISTVTASGNRYTRCMTIRGFFSIFVVLALVFNQMAATVHAVDHLETTDNHHSADSHQLSFSDPGHHAEHHAEYGDKISLLGLNEKHAESLLDCLSYHVLLATPGSIAADSRVVSVSAGLCVVAEPIDCVCNQLTAKDTPIRGPPLLT